MDFEAGEVKAREKIMKPLNVMIAVAVTGMVLSAVSSQAQLDLSGGTVVGSMTQSLIGFSPMSDNGVYNGTISSWVVSDTAVGSPDSTGLIFIYQVVNDGPDAINHIEFTGFNSSEILTADDYTSVTGITGGASPALSGADFGSFSLTGAANANFDGGNLSSNSASEYLVIETDASGYGVNYGQEQDDFSAEGNIYAPVPEANTILAGALMILPFGVGVVRALRKDRSV